MNEPSSGFDPVEELVDSFLARYRRGERPSLTEYTVQHPELAERIRALFPALMVVEELGSRGGPASKHQVGGAGTGASMPQRLGDYLLLRPIGSGGMGTVYEAIQESLGRHVALKTLPFHHLGDSTRLERFRREARAAARLHHTHIVPIFGVGEHEGLHYYTMQFIRGHGLDTVLQEVERLRQDSSASAAAGAPAGQQLSTVLALGLRSGRLPVDEMERAGSTGAVVSQSHRGLVSAPPATTPLLSPSGDRSELSDQPDAQYLRSVARIGIQVAEALEYAHKQGILHRDIKPSNLLLDAQGEVWVTDFGLAKAQDSDELTRTGDIVGTLRYMAPERFDGWSDPRSDVYALGATLYELLTLRPAFDESDRVKLIDRVLHDGAIPLRQLDRRIPRDLETVVLKALAKEPADRYATAGQLAEDLRRFVAGKPILARRSNPFERSWRWSKRNPLAAGLMAAVAALLLVLVVGFLLSALVRQERDLARANQDRAENAERRALTAEREINIRAHLARAMAWRQSAQAGQRTKTLAEVAEALQRDPSPELRQELRNTAIAALALPDIEVAREWDGHPPGTSEVDFDADLEHYARKDEKGNVSVRRLADDVEIARLEGIGPVGWPAIALSPDGRFLAQRGLPNPNGRLKLWKLDGPKPALVLEDATAGYHLAGAFRADSRQLAIARPDSTVRLYDTATGCLVKQWPVTGPVERVAFHPRMARLALSRGTAVQVLDLETGNVLTESSHPDHVSCLAWHPEGRLLAIGCDDERIYLWDTTTNTKALPPLESHKTRAVQLCFNHAGDRLVSDDLSFTLRLWDPWSGRQLLDAPHSRSGNLHFTTDDRHLGGFHEGPKLRLLRIMPGRELTVLRSPLAFGKGTNHYLGPSHTDGCLLAVPSARGLALLDLTRGKELALIPGRDVGGVLPLGFEASGALRSYGENGLLHWPVRADPIERGLLKVGPPLRLAESSVQDRWGQSGDGRVVAIPNSSAGATVLHLDQPQKRMVLAPQRDVRSCAVSPDGRWVATGSLGALEEGGAKVWDAVTGQLIKTLPVAGLCHVGFTLDGRWLATASAVDHQCHLWAAGSWKAGPKIPSLSWFALSPRGNWLAVAGERPGEVLLVETGTGKEIAHLAAPVRTLLLPGCISPDDSRLVANDTDSGTLCIWDLRAIRAALSEMGLDWDLPPCDPAGDVTNAPPLRVSLDLGELAELRTTAEDEARLKIANCRQDLAKSPDDAQRCNSLAWAYLTVPEPLRDLTAALGLAEKAVRLEPKNAIYINTLGLAYYRAGRLRAAEATLRPNLRNQGNRTLAFDLYILSMTCQRLGDVDRARDYFTWAVRWPQSAADLTAGQLSELQAFRGEAEAVLGIEVVPAPRGK
jgi:eukaryotic-like serine/threonine-protein kinase